MCTATNETPHDCVFKFPQRSMSGRTIPVWLTEPGTVLAKKHVRDKYDPLVDEVDLLNANQNYAVIRHPSGQEATVSTRDFAPTATDVIANNEEPASIKIETGHSPNKVPVAETSEPTTDVTNELQTSLQRRSSRQKRVPDRFGR